MGTRCVLLRRRRPWLVFGTLLTSWTLLTTIACAHAYVSSTSPATNGTVATSPTEISVSFDEPISVESSDALVAYRVSGANVQCAGGAMRDPADRKRIVCKIAAPLPKGAYIVAWRVTSDDTHVVHGVFSFGIGVAVHGEYGETPSIYDPAAALATAFRWLSLAGAALLFGALAFDRLVLRGGAFPASSGAALAALRRRCGFVRRGGLCAALLGSIGSLDIQAAAATGSDWLRALPALGSIAVGSKWGIAWSVRVGALLAIAALTWRRASPPVALAPAATVLAALVLLTFSVSGHAVDTDQEFQLGLRVLADWLHLTGAALWSGGLLVFAVGIRPALRSLATAERMGFSRIAIARFSTVAIASVATLVATGIYASAVQVHSWPDLLATLYGRIVLAKVALLIPLLALGYRHYRQGKGSDARADFAGSATLEAILLLAVIGLSALLSGLAPPFPKPAQMDD
jgi:copper transport protein